MRIAALTLALLLGTITAFAAPVPKSDPIKALPDAKATAPGLVVLRPSDDGKVKITVMKTENRKVQKMIGVPPGAAPAQPIVREITVRTPGEVELSEVKDLKVYNTAGKEVPKDDALKALAKGGVVVVSGDGKPVDPAYLATFREGTLVLVAPDLVVDRRAIAGGTAASGPAMPPVAFPGGVPGGPPAIPVPPPAPPK